MDIEKIKLQIVRYMLDTLMVNAPSLSEAFEIPIQMVKGININVNYESEVFPYFHLSIMVPSWVYRAVQIDPDAITISMCLKQSLFSEDQADTPSNSTVYKGVYKAILSENDALTDSDRQEQISIDDEAYGTGYTYSDMYSLDLILMNRVAYAATKVTKVDVMTSSTLTNALGYVLTQYGFSNVLLTPATNKKTYTEFKFPPITGEAHIQRICNKYKIHSTRTTVHFGLDRTYLVDKTYKCNTWYTNEKTITHIICLNAYSDVLSAYDGVEVNEKDKYTILNVRSDAFKADDIAELEISDVGVVMTIGTTAATFDALTPNKEFRVMLDNPKSTNYNGTYRILKYSATLTNAGDYLSPSFTITIGK